MIDPAAIGTVIIGLEADRRRAASTATARAEGRLPSRTRGIRHVSALALVRLARRIDPFPSA
jgi:hypothetical protein